VADGAARYAQARRAALGNHGDPQGARPGWRDPRAVVAELMAPCATGLPGGGTCGVPMAEHHLTDPSDKWPRGRRTYCTRQDGPRHHPCNEYTPA
jgi:hypothetical protein